MIEKCPVAESLDYGASRTKGISKECSCISWSNRTWTACPIRPSVDTRSTASVPATESLPWIYVPWAQTRVSTLRSFSPDSSVVNRLVNKYWRKSKIVACCFVIVDHGYHRSPVGRLGKKCTESWVRRPWYIRVRKEIVAELWLAVGYLMQFEARWRVGRDARNLATSPTDLRSSCLEVADRHRPLSLVADRGRGFPPYRSRQAQTRPPCLVPRGLPWLRLRPQ